MTRFTSVATTVAALLLLVGSAGPAASREMTDCRMTFDLEGWSIFYKHAKGDGRITCTNGQAANVRIVTHGGGPTFGTERVINGRGTFSAVEDISDLYGGYAEAAVHAGAGGSADARVLMKGNVSLTLAGTGQGINLGIAFGSFRIQPK
jgi:hypothetical protein